MFKLICDVCADIPVFVSEERNIILMPMSLTVNGDERVYKAQEFDAKVFYDGMRQGNVCSTSQVPAEVFKEFFRPILANGDDILFICLSSGLSGSHNNSLLALDELKEEFPERKMFSVDSLGASMGEGLLTLRVAKLRDEGKSIEECAQWAEENKHNVMHWFTVDDLQYLRRGGRVSATSAMVGTLLDIKPVLQCNSEGKLVPYEKVKGRKRAVKSMFAKADEFGVDIDGQEICISHGDCEDEALLLRDMLAAKYPSCTFVMGNIGAVIGSHSGPGTIALFFMGVKRFK
ncbi:MAG: DegV family protein [Clostridia bacterium]|nr:DegV family protein [Clostridia bacterium]